MKYLILNLRFTLEVCISALLFLFFLLIKIYQGLN